MTNREDQTRWLLLLRWTVLLVTLSMIATACTGGADPDGDSEDDNGGATEPGATALAVTDVIPEGRDVQDVLIHLDLAKGEGSDRISVIDQVVDHARQNAGSPVVLEDGLTWTAVDGFDPKVLDAEDEALTSINLATGLLGVTEDEWSSRLADAPAEVRAAAEGVVAEDAQLFVEIATADYEKSATHVRPGDRGDLDLTFIKEIAPGDTLTSHYLFLQTTPDPDRAAEAGLDGHELFVHRWNKGLYRFLGDEQDGPSVIEDSTVEVVEGSSRRRQLLKFLGLGGGLLAGGTATILAAAALSLSGPVAAVLIGAGTLGGGLIAWVPLELENEPPDPCTGDCGSSGGDVHLRTIDGQAYDSQLVGEFVLHQSDAVVAHVRQEPHGDSDRISVNTALAVDLGGTTVSLHAGPEITVFIDDEPRALSRGEAIPVGAGSMLWTGSMVVLAGADDTMIWVRLTGSSLSVQVATGATGATGLLGDADGDPANDLKARGGDVLDTAVLADPARVHAEFADTWRVTQEESLLHYEAGESTETFTDRDFPYAPANLDDANPDERAEAEKACRAAGLVGTDLDNCILDVALTGDHSFILAALIAQVSGAGSATGATGSVGGDAAWIQPLDGVARTSIQNPLRAVDGMVFAFGKVTDGGSVMVALDAVTGEERWRLPDVVANCSITAAGDDHLAVVLGAETEHNDQSHNALALLSDGGAVVALDDSGTRMPETYCGAMQTFGDVVVVPGSLGHLSGWETTGGAIKKLWHHNPHLAPVIADAEGSLIVVRGPRSDHELAAIDPATGADLSAVSIEGTVVADGLHLVTSNDRIAVAMRDQDGNTPRVGTLFGFRIDDGQLTETWQLPSLSADDGAPDGLDFEHAFSSLSAEDNLLIAHHGSGELVALDLADGELEWRFTLPGFRNTTTSAPVVDGVVLDTIFGGSSVIEVADGALQAAHEPEDLHPGYGSPNWLGPVHDGHLFLATVGDDAAAVVAVRVGSE
ncbi:PQQ-binding-like beta-propeller repeat protein [Nocardioides sp. AE5]|uniref:outer membrane protein assembly factor BamB family protein n=1 Tax=Nocardioides sp. AE5 TaxID=2962573 RepID=UPI002881499E|nr:PQQ-binding-like beta-propeller repeat protein [Nocardioides sp. AE5]MDT0203968.1 PQQ-binding-like beta-propeller repeat protein [Nocardioides sp. AE5]